MLRTPMRWCYWDSLDYEQALALQQRLRSELLRGAGESGSRW